MPYGEPTSPADPQNEYVSRRDAATSEVKQFKSQDGTLSTVRGVVFLMGILLSWLSMRGTVAGWWVLLAVVLFAATVIVHTRIIAALRLARRRVAGYQVGLDRIQGRWLGIGAAGTRYRDPDHVYVDDLDIFGEGSLFQLICRARTRLGEAQLADWFRQPADRDTILARHQAVQELKDDVDLREQLALLDAEVHDDFDQNALLQWSTIPSRPLRPAVRVFAVLISVSTITTFLAWWFRGTFVSPLAASLVVLMLFLFAHRRLIMSVLSGVDDAGKGLAILVQVLEVLEGRQFESPSLNEIVGRLKVEGVPPSQSIARLNTQIQYLDNSMRNQFFAPLAVILCLPLHLVHAIEQWRETIGRHIPRWCSAVAEFEALVSLSGYAYEQPENRFPQLSEEHTRLKATGLGHPLLSDDECVRNDVQLDDDTKLLLVSGSNMSGKSTLLRTVGTNVVLALAGAPVRAENMEISPCQLGTAMRISDSLLEGKSLFFAVLGRIKRVVDLAEGEQPLLFLLDEILQGTNSHDRRIGAEAVIRNLLDRGAVGLVTTHDLALTDIADSLPGAVNVHFADQLQDGEMTFDYHLRNGVVEKSNAIELMRLVGLDV